MDRPKVGSRETLFAALIVLLGLASALEMDQAVAGNAPSTPRALVPAARFAPAGRLTRNGPGIAWRPPPRSRPAARAQVGQRSCIPCDDPCVRWTFSLPIWIPGVNANMSDGSVSASGDRNPSDLVDPKVATEIQFAFVGALTARKGRWGVDVDFFTATIDSTADFSISDGLITAAASGRIRATMARARVDYLYSRATLPWNFQRCGRAEHRVYAGARVYDVAASAQARRIAALSLEVSDTWVEPIVGFHSAIPFARRWSVLFGADMGGFGLESNWSWSALAGAQWRFARRWRATFAYNILDFRRVAQIDAKRTVFDIRLSGPQLAISFDL